MSPLTATEQRIWSILSDGQPHSANELMIKGVRKRFGDPNIVPVNISRMRPKVAPEWVIQRPRGGKGYQAKRSGQ